MNIFDKIDTGDKLVQEVQYLVKDHAIDEGSVRILNDFLFDNGGLEDILTLSQELLKNEIIDACS